MNLTLSESPKTGFLATRSNYGPAHEMLVLIAYATKIPSNTHADLFCGAKCLNLDMKTSSFICVLIDLLLTVKAATLIFISGCGSAISSAKEGKSGFIYTLVKSI